MDSRLRGNDAAECGKDAAESASNAQSRFFHTLLCGNDGLESVPHAFRLKGERASPATRCFVKHFRVEPVSTAAFRILEEPLPPVAPKQSELAY
jgi:hypothetical protein